jgi:formylglycine-generating enzyme required for sulfatase activity
MKWASLKVAVIVISLVLLITLAGISATFSPYETAKCVRAGQIRVSPVDGTVQVCVPSGTFLMGAEDADPLAGDDEKPAHPVYLPSYWIDKTEITNAQYLRCMTAGMCHPQIYETSALTYTPYSVHPDYQDHPALIYIYDDAADYCRWAGRRLPTEAEWEKASRGSDGRMYPWGNEQDCSHADYYICNHVPEYDPRGPRCGYSSYCRTAPVTDYPAGASPYGALNMSGNVWEWVSDFYSPDYYRICPVINPTGPTKGEFHTRRGGGATSLAADLRVTVRASGKGEHYYDGQMGFRCAADAGK